jgi:flavin-dependent dehydrogenase
MSEVDKRIMSQIVKHIVIVGGGTAGWLTAGILAAQHASHLTTGIQVTLIESSKIPTIGVGEGTWPTMRDTLSSIGISEIEFIACCDASFKQGSQFINWKTEDKGDSYYHPFMAPHGFGQTDLVSFWHSNQQLSFAHALAAQPHLCDHNKAPKQFQTPDFAAVTNYGYHLNAGKFAKLLKQHCINNLGVKHIDDKVTGVLAAANGDIASVNTEHHGAISAELFVDCSGQHGLIIDKHYKVPLVKLESTLFNNRAIAVQVPYQEQNQTISSHTISTAHDFGWVWDIALPTRRGVGNVYSSRFCDDELATRHLTDHLSKSLSCKQINKLTFKALKFTPGYRKQFWVNNCIAIGMSAGFIEPLEASALALVELSAKMLAKELPADKSIIPIAAKRFNKRFEYRWQRIIDFLKLHYVLSNRKSDYWQSHREADSIPEHLNELLTLWQHQPPSYNDFIQIEEIFPAASYQYVLYGMGFKTKPRATQQQYVNHLLAEKLTNENIQLINKYLAGLPTNRELINHITAQYQLQKAG